MTASSGKGRGSGRQETRGGHVEAVLYQDVLSMEQARATEAKTSAVSCLVALQTRDGCTGERTRDTLVVNGECVV